MSQSMQAHAALGHRRPPKDEVVRVRVDGELLEELDRTVKELRAEGLDASRSSVIRVAVQAFVAGLKEDRADA